MKKKLVPFALLFTYLLPLVGCGGSKTCTITFDPNNGEPTFSVTVNKGELLPEPENPEMTAYDFKAWRNNNVKWSFKYEKVQSDMTLKAFYVPIEYSLQVLPNGGYLRGFEDSYTIESDYEKIAQVAKPGYIVDYFVDQDGNHITTLKGQYGDKVLTPHWLFDEEHFIQCGQCPTSLVKDQSLITSLDNALPNSNYYGDITYGGDLYLRFATNYHSPIDNTRIPNFSNIYLKYEPINWVKLYETDQYIVCMSVYILDCYKPSLEPDMSQYSRSNIDIYVQGLVNELFSDEEINNLYDFKLEDATAKMFLPSMEELTIAMDTLKSLPLLSDYSYDNMSIGVFSTRSIIEDKCSWSTSCSGTYINYLAGSYATRTLYENGMLRIVESSNYMNIYSRGSLNIRPCIAIKK